MDVVDGRHGKVRHFVFLSKLEGESPRMLYSRIHIIMNMNQQRVAALLLLKRSRFRPSARCSEYSTRF